MKNGFTSSCGMATEFHQTNSLYIVLRDGHHGTLLLWEPTNCLPVLPHLAVVLSIPVTPGKARKPSTTPW